MPIARTRTFRSGNSEAIRLPKDLAFGEDTDLVVVRSGDVMTIYPAATSIAAMIMRLRSLPVPPTIEQRDREELPERPKLKSGGSAWTRCLLRFPQSPSTMLPPMLIVPSSQVLVIRDENCSTV